MIGGEKNSGKKLQENGNDSLTTGYHPQADGQTKVLNQSLEISLCTYISPSINAWASYLNALELSYNTTPIQPQDLLL